MEFLSKCPTHGARANCMVEASNGQELCFVGDLPVVVVQIDADDCFWPGDQRPDAVLIAELPPTVRGERFVVGFVELKSRLRPAEHKASLQQLEMGISHFEPSARLGGFLSHGDAHHRRWSEGQDVLPVMPDGPHRVAAISVGFREGRRFPPQVRQTVFFCSMILAQHHSTRVTQDTYEFLKGTGLLTTL